ncbi:hypothetical protein RB195_026569 [Necator americanus]|uniref:Uncharacterized protein n=1 Tax=Necator americanus TaxID=51031 RepID=A0ABR1EXL6_NECAM
MHDPLTCPAFLPTYPPACADKTVETDVIDSAWVKHVFLITVQDNLDDPTVLTSMDVGYDMLDAPKYHQLLDLIRANVTDQRRYQHLCRGVLSLNISKPILFDLQLEYA